MCICCRAKRCKMSEKPGVNGGEEERKKKSCIAIIIREIFPRITLQQGRESVSRSKSLVVVSFLYVNHLVTTWGYRMWDLGAPLLLALLYPGSLLLPAVYGFLTQLITSSLTTLVGDWIDANPRMKIMWVTLVSQNLFVMLSAIVTSLLFELHWNVCENLTMFAGLIPLIMIFGSGGFLATTANLIALEKDWVVVVSDKNDDTLAILNANMRRIDLICKLCAPALVGIVLQHTGPFVTTLIIAVWNIVSFVLEVLLIIAVYEMIPALGTKKLRIKDKVIHSKSNGGQSNGTILSNLSADKGQADEENRKDDNDDASSQEEEEKHSCPFICCTCLLNPLSTLINGWRIYLRQEIALAGIALALTYLTVLGFSGVTAAYLLTQGLRPDIIGICQGIGAIFGILGTILFPCLRRLAGTVRTGLFGVAMQVFILMFCIVAIVVPSKRISSDATGYYSADCNAFFLNGSNLTNTSYVMEIDEEYLYSQMNSPSPSPTPGIKHMHPEVIPDELILTSALIFMLVGVICSRTGIWLFDLAVQQLIQEKVREEERGVVNGVIKSMMCFFDTLHYVLVIAAPRPEYFRILTIISVGMVTLSLILYAAYVRKVRDHVLHVVDCYRRVLKCGCHGLKDGERRKLLENQASNNVKSETNKAE